MTRRPRGGGAAAAAGSAAAGSRAVDVRGRARAGVGVGAVAHKGGKSAKRARTKTNGGSNKNYTSNNGSRGTSTLRTFPNQYKGFHPPDASYTLDVVDPQRITPAEFLTQYILARKPCLLVGPPIPSSPTSTSTSSSTSSTSASSTRDVGDATANPEWHLDRWSNEYLRAKAGSAVVQVEQRFEHEVGFGRGRKVTMSFAQLIDKMESGDEHYYMTTQYMDDEQAAKLRATSSAGVTTSTTTATATTATATSTVDLDARYLVASPLTHLLDDFPLLPHLFRSLFPHQYNMWFGTTTTTPRTSTTSSTGQSTGLHHDYHDNLYVLVRGCKHFTLFSPNDAHLMQTHGRIRKVLPNGLIAYEDGVEEDGSVGAEVRKEKKRMIEERIGGLEEQLRASTEGADERARVQHELNEHEQMLEDVLDAMLMNGDEECAFGGGSDDDDEGEGGGFGFRDDYVESEDERDSDDDDDGDDDDDDRRSSRKTKAKRRRGGAVGPSTDRRSTVGKSTRADDGDKDDTPPNFCRIPSTPPPQGSTPIHVHMRAGQMLFLPASWFHEVRSKTSDDVRGGHMALNFWFLPARWVAPPRAPPPGAALLRKKAAAVAPALAETASEPSSSSFATCYQHHEVWTYRWQRQQRALLALRDSCALVTTQLPSRS